MIARISSLFLVCWSISVASISFMRMSLASERKNISITDLTARAQNNSSCVLGMTISYSENVLMDKSSIWWVVLSDSTTAFYAWALLMRLQVWITILDTPTGTNSEGHDHTPCVICFTLDICKYE